MIDSSTPSGTAACSDKAGQGQFRIRRDVLLADRESVRSIVERTGFFSASEVEIAVQLLDDRLTRGPASDYSFLLAEFDGSVVGYACYGPIACTTGSYDLYWIGVDPSVQRQGLGRRLLEEAESAIRQAGGRRVYIDTSSRAQYAPTRAFYEAHGYVPAARLEDFYAAGDDKVVYVKVLADTP